MWPAFLARVSPVTRNANPTCMNRTRNPVIRSHTKLIEIRRCPLSLASWLMPCWVRGTDFTPFTTGGFRVDWLTKSDPDPVFVPPGRHCG